MIEFEHTLFILLLLNGLLNAKPPKQNIAILVILIGVLLVFIPPANNINIPWEIILGLVIPILLWQNIRRTTTAKWRGWNSFILWVVTALFFSFFLLILGSYSWSSGFLLGLIVASMIWRAGEPESGASYMSQIGSFTLLFLLTEVDVVIQSPNQYIGGIFSAAFNGLLSALFGLFLLRKFGEKHQAWFGIGQVYMAYWVSYFIGVSPITAALVSVFTYVWLRRYTHLGHYKDTLPTPLKSWVGFSVFFAIFLLLGWQGHQSVSNILLIEVLVGTILGIGIVWIGKKSKNPAFQNQDSFWVFGLRIALMLFPALLIWPRGILQQPNQLIIAIGLSILVLGLSYLGRFELEKN